MKNGFIDLNELQKLETKYNESALVLTNIGQMLQMFLLLEDFTPNDGTILDETRHVVINTLEKYKVLKRIGQ